MKFSYKHQKARLDDAHALIRKAMAELEEAMQHEISDDEMYQDLYNDAEILAGRIEMNADALAPLADQEG